MKGVKFLFEFEEATWDFLGNAVAQKGLISHGRENFIVVVELWWKLKVPLELRGNLGDPLMFHRGSQICFLVARGTSGFLSHCCRDE